MTREPRGELDLRPRRTRPRGRSRRGRGYGRNRRRMALVSDPVVLLLSGPNLNLLGQRQPEVYGTATLDAHVGAAVKAAAALGLTVEHHQSNSEAVLVERTSRGEAVAAVIINPGALSHYGCSSTARWRRLEGPIIEHLSQPRRREPWRRTSVVTPVATGCISGLEARLPLGRGGGRRLAGPGLTGSGGRRSGSGRHAGEEDSHDRAGSTRAPRREWGSCSRASHRDEEWGRHIDSPDPGWLRRSR